MLSRHLGRFAAVSLTVALVLTAAPADAANPYRSQARQAADWLGTQLSDGKIVNQQYDFVDWGLTVDTGFALAADGTHPAQLTNLRHKLAANVRTYISYRGDYFAGATAKTLLFTKVVRARPRDFGGLNVRGKLLSLMVRSGAESGRFRDQGATDYSNTIAQSYAVLGLARTGGVPQRAVRHLIEQRCPAGFFRLRMSGSTTCREAAHPVPDVDATALALQAMVAARRSGVTVLKTTIARTGAWLAKVQHANGSFGGGASTAGANTNSTGLAAQALNAVDRTQARLHAARYVAAQQITKRRAGSGPARRDIGAIAYNHAALKAALRDGVTAQTRDQFRRATPQAYFALNPKPFSTLVAPK